MPRVSIVIGLGMGMVALAACGRGGGGEPPMVKEVASSPVDLVAVDLAPIPLKLKAAKGAAVTQKSPDDDFKMVRVDLANGHALAVEDLTHGAQKTFALQKEKREHENGFFPFKKWEVEGTDRAIFQFEKNGKTGYFGFAVREIGGKIYSCSTAGIAGRASVAEVEDDLKVCDGMAST